MKRIIPILMTLLLLSGCATQSAEKTYRQITMEEAITMMEEETGYIILDVRTAQEYSEKHIPGAINIANESIGTEDISEMPDKDQLILVYCRSGNRSKHILLTALSFGCYPRSLFLTTFLLFLHSLLQQ